jgi:hypothetical protein
MVIKKKIITKSKLKVLPKVIRDKKIIELKERLKRFRKAIFTKEELDVIKKKLVFGSVVVHFTDIHFLRDIMLKGISYGSQGTVSSLSDLRKIKGVEYSDALGRYRHFKTRKYEHNRFYQKQALTIKEFILNDMLVGFNKPKFKQLLRDRRFINTFELNELLSYYKRFVLNKKDLSVFKKNELIRIQELQSRVRARELYFDFKKSRSRTLRYDFTSMTINPFDRINSSMNVGLLFDRKPEMFTFFGKKNIDYQRVIYLDEGVKIKGMVTYKDNFKDVFKIMLENSRSIADIVPIYDYNGKVLFPKVK